MLWAVVVGSILGSVGLAVLEDLVHIRLRVRSWSWARIRAVAIRSSAPVSDGLESMV